MFYQRGACQQVDALLVSCLSFDSLERIQPPAPPSLQLDALCTQRLVGAEAPFGESLRSLRRRPNAANEAAAEGGVAGIVWVQAVS